MPSETTVGKPGLNNEKIGGVPTIHYLDFQSRGRGQVVRLMWEDADIAYTDVRYSFAEYPEFQKSTIADLNPVKSVPIVELNSQVLVQSYAILRHFSRQLGAYDGSTEAEKYFVDAMCDIAIDWRTLFIQAFFSEKSEETYKAHCEGDRIRYLGALERHLTSNDLSRSGSFVIGKTFTYADMVIYQVCHDENLTQNGRKGLEQYPRLAKLVDAVESRPNVKRFLESDRYLG